MTSPTDFKVALLEKQNCKLREEIEERDETIRQLRAELSGPDELPGWLPHLTGRESDFLRVLASRDRLLTKEALYVAVYGSTDNGPDLKIVDVIICKLRRKLIDHGIIIETVWGQGYKLDRDSRQLLLPRAAA